MKIWSILLDQQDDRTNKDSLLESSGYSHFRRENTRRYLNTTNSETGKGCDLSPLLFTYYSEVMFREALGCRVRFKHKWKGYQYHHHADDTFTIYMIKYNFKKLIELAENTV